MRSVCTADVNRNSTTKWVICTFNMHLEQLGGITVYENKWPKPTWVLLRCGQCWLLSFNAGSVKRDLPVQWILRGWMVQSSANTAEWLTHSIKIKDNEKAFNAQANKPNESCYFKTVQEKVAVFVQANSLTHGFVNTGAVDLWCWIIMIVKFYKQIVILASRCFQEGVWKMEKQKAWHRSPKMLSHGSL